MTAASITRLELPSDATNRPAASSQTGLGMTALLVLPAVAGLLAPFGVLAAAAIEQPTILATLSDMPGTAVQLGLGLIISLLFCVLPFYLRTTNVVRQPTAAHVATLPQTAEPVAVMARAPRDDAVSARPLAA